MPPDTSPHAEHFESLEHQAHAAHLGMWIFLASEIFLFAGLFALYAVYRVQHPQAFDLGLAHSQKTIGSINTLILLTSSYTMASAVVSLRAAKRGATLMLLSATIGLGIGFLVLKIYEYSLHFDEGIRPGMEAFWTLYYLMTGLHVIHVCAGLSVLAWMTWQVGRGRVAPPHDHPVALAAMYWHLVDLVWIFLWPLFYLTGVS